MAEIIDDIAYLTQEIGPHPAGTEEEQRAALYLADQMQKEAGFATVVEDSFVSVLLCLVPFFLLLFPLWAYFGCFSL